MPQKVYIFSKQKSGKILPHEIKQLDSLKEFKKAIKQGNQNARVP